MARVMIICPSTKKAVPTGIGMDEKSFASSTMSNNSVSCSACGQTHTWSKSDAFLEKPRS